MVDRRVSRPGLPAAVHLVRKWCRLLVVRVVLGTFHSQLRQLPPPVLMRSRSLVDRWTGPRAEGLAMQSSHSTVGGRAAVSWLRLPEKGSRLSYLRAGPQCGPSYVLPRIEEGSNAARVICTGTSDSTRQSLQ